MEPATIILLVSFLIFLLINVPVAFAIGLSTLLAFFAEGIVPEATITAQRIACGVEKFSLLAIPFFILSGILMGKGGIARRLIDFAGSLVGRTTGGLAHVNTLTCMMFGSISGSAAAAVSSVGGFMIPEMNRKGYDRDFNIAVTTTAATTGLLIPPSNIMIVYAMAAGGVSISAMFMAGILPGVLIGLSIMIVNFILCKIYGFGKTDEETQTRNFKAKHFAIILGGIVGLGAIVAGAIAMGLTNLQVALAVACYVFLAMSFSPQARKAIPSLLLIVIVIGGILSGVFTATEAAGVAVAYSFILAVLVYREVKFKDLPEILLASGITTAVIMLLIGASSAMSWHLAFDQIPQNVAKGLIGMQLGKIQLLIMLNVLLLIVGTFMDMTPAVLIFTPIFLPVCLELGMSPIHFGIMIIANLCIGLCTPPVGTCLFVGCGVGGSTISKVTGKMLPYYLAMIISLLAITYIPFISTWLPGVLK